jgi:hypothetical protein
MLSRGEKIGLASFFKRCLDILFAKDEYYNEELAEICFNNICDLDGNC